MIEIQSGLLRGLVTLIKEVSSDLACSQASLEGLAPCHSPTQKSSAMTSSARPSTCQEAWHRYKHIDHL